MKFAPECFWAFQTKASFWAIFQKLIFFPPLHFFRKCGFCMTLPKLPYLCHSGTFGAAFCAKIFSSLHFKCILVRDNAICARVLVGLFSEGIFLGDFWKISLGPPFSLFQKMQLLGDFAKTARTWSFGNFWSRFFAPKSFPVFAL